MIFRNRILLLALSHAWAVGAQPGAVAEERIEWKTGAAFRQQLEASLGIRWAGNPLRRAVTNLSRDQHVAVLLDRRLDPDQPLEFAVEDLALDGVWKKLAASLGVGVAYVQDVVYLGPSETTRLLATVAALRRDETAQLAEPQRRRLGAPRPTYWAELSAPRALIEQLAKEHGVEVRELERVPHDLWPALELPPLAFADRLSLLLAGFSLTFRYEEGGRAVRLVPWPDQAEYLQEYPLGSDAAAVLAQLRAEFPDMELHPAERRLAARGSWEDHERLGRFLRGERVVRRTVTSGEKRFSLTVQNQPVGSILRTLRDRLMLQIELEPGADQGLARLVSFEAKDATLAEVLEATLAPAGLRYELQEKTLRIRP